MSRAAVGSSIIMTLAPDDAATITAAGGSVSLWSDKAGSFDLAQSFGPEQPQTGIRALNGLNVLDFGGSERMLTTITLPASGDVAFHAALIVELKQPSGHAPSEDN